MIIRQFLTWTQHASADRRAEAAAALTRAYLHGGLAPDTAWEAENALLALLDDPAAIVRRALAEACAACATAPRPLVIALAADQADIASLVLARSPVLTDADLVDGVAIGCAVTRAAIAGRAGLSGAVAGAMAEIGEESSLVALARNHGARLTVGAALRMIERHGESARLREALLARAGLPLEARHAAMTLLADSLSADAIASGSMTPARSARASREARERATLSFSADAHAVDLARLVAHLRKIGQLNAGLLLRAILSRHIAFAEAALADLSGLKADRVAGLMREGAAYSALHRKAGLPAELLPAFAAALSAWREMEEGATEALGAGLSRRMIERALTACEAMPSPQAQTVLALLARYDAEAARDEARLVARDLGDQAVGHGALAALPSPAAAVMEEAAAQEALSLHVEILDAEWREAQAGVARARAPAAPVVAEAAFDPVGAVLSGLSDALMATFQESRDQTFKAAADAAPDTIPDALIASYRADRERMKLAA